jgi:hypothetical protein
LPLRQFFFWGGGVSAEKRITLGGLRISEKEEILRKLTAL